LPLLEKNGLNLRIGFFETQEFIFVASHRQAQLGGEGDARSMLSAARNPRMESFMAIDGQLAPPLRASAI